MIGEVKMTKSPLRFSELNIKSSLAPPLLGEHTDEILSKELGYSEEELAELREMNVI